MNEPIDRATVEHVASLARLQLTEEELGRMQHDLADVLAYIARLDQLDTNDVVPMATPDDRSAPLADDEPLPPLEHEALQHMAPAMHDDFIAIPKVLGGTDAETISGHG